MASGWLFVAGAAALLSAALAYETSFVRPAVQTLQIAQLSDRRTDVVQRTNATLTSESRNVGVSDGRVPASSRLDRTISEYRAKVTENPQLYPVWAQLGGAFLKRARFRSSWADRRHAAHALIRSLEIQPNAVAWRWLAAVRLDQHRFPEAASLARQAVEAWNVDGISRAIWSDALLAMGKYDEASAVLRGQSDDFYSRVGYSRLLFLTGRPMDAITQLRRAIVLLENPSSDTAIRAKAWCYLMIGGYHFELGNAGEALSAYKHARSLDPMRIDILEHIAEWEAIYGDKEKSVRIYRDIIATTQRPQEFLALGAVLIDLGRSNEGKNLIDRAIAIWRNRLGKGDISVRRELALALLDYGGSAQEALGLATADLEIRRDALAYDTLAWALYKTGAIDQAKQALGQALQHGTPNRYLREHANIITTEVYP